MTTTEPADPSASSPFDIDRLLDAAGAVDLDDPQVVKACCASAYGTDLVTMLLGDSFHPGGADLTRRLAAALDLQPGQQVLDVASGIGTTALLLADECNVDVLGIDLGDTQVSRARTRARDAGLSDRVRFELGDAERLPVDDDTYDAVVCECAFCTFPDKATAAAELARVIRPGGQVGITDIWLDPTTLDPELQGLAGRIACIADARPIDEVRTILETAGLVVTNIERHDHALIDTIERVTDRLRAARLLKLPILESVDISRGIELAQRAADAVDGGDAGYMLLTATKR
jgi:arsenite methyltransferase